MITVEIAQTVVVNGIGRVEVETVEVETQMGLEALEAGLSEHQWILDSY